MGGEEDRSSADDEVDSAADSEEGSERSRRMAPFNIDGSLFCEKIHEKMGILLIKISLQPDRQKI